MEAGGLCLTVLEACLFFFHVLKWYVFVFLYVLAGFGSLLFLMGLEMECSQGERFVVEVDVGVDSGRYHGFLYCSLR